MISVSILLNCSDHSKKEEEKSVFSYLNVQECGTMFTQRGNQLMSPYPNVPAISKWCSQKATALSVCARACAFSRTVRTCLLLFKEQTGVILTRPRSLGTQLSVPISFIGCPNSVSLFLEEEVRNRRNAKCSIQQDFLTDTVKVMHHKVLLIRLHYSSWIEKLSVLKGQCTRIMDGHIFTLSLEFAV